jgi:hypothetical protein
MKTVTSQEKMEAWMRVGKLCEQALALLVAVNEGPCEQAKLSWIAEKAPIQAQLWNEGGE